MKHQLLKSGRIYYISRKNIFLIESRTSFSGDSHVALVWAQFLRVGLLHTYQPCRRDESLLRPAGPIPLRLGTRVPAQLGRVHESIKFSSRRTAGVWVPPHLIYFMNYNSSTLSSLNGPTNLSILVSAQAGKLFCIGVCSRVRQINYLTADLLNEIVRYLSRIGGHPG